MKVKVKKLVIPNPTKEIVNSDMTDYLKLEDEYLVYGLTLGAKADYVQIFKDNYLTSIPLELFSITDNTVSKYWKVERHENGFIRLWPEEFFQEFFHDDLSEGVEEIKEIFKQVKEKMISESSH